MAQPTSLSVRRDGDTAFLCLSRPHVRNAIDASMLAALEVELDAIAADDTLRIVVLQGDGGYFCAGGDLKERRGLTDPQVLSQRNAREGALLTRLAKLPQLLIGVVEGGAVGAGLGMICTCDLVLATPDSRFFAPEVMTGAIPAQITAHLVRRIGLSAATRILLTDSRPDAVEAQRLGLVHVVMQLDPQVELTALLERLAPAEAAAIAATKTLLRDVAPLDEDYPDRASHLYRMR